MSTKFKQEENPTMPGNKIFIGLFSSMFFFIGSFAWADHPSIGISSELVGPIQTISAITLPKSRWSIGSRTEYLKLDSFSDSSLEQFALQGKEIHSTDYLLSPSIGISYGLTDNLMLSLGIPYVLRSNIREGHIEDDVPEVHVHKDSKGIGDITLFSKYHFDFMENNYHETAFLFGLKVPAGNTHAKDKNNMRFETEHQPGSGSWDPFMGVAITKKFKILSFNANILYTFATEGEDKTNLGDLFNYNLAITHRIGGETGHSHSTATDVHHDHASHMDLVWDLIFELNGERRQRLFIAGTKDDNSGGSLLYISPGIRLTANNKWSASLLVGFPVYQDLNGNQHDTDLRVIFGIGIGL